MRILVLNPTSLVAKNVVRDVLYGCWCKGKRIGGGTVPPFALLLVATVLKRDGNDVTFLDSQAERIPFSGIKRTIKDFDVVIISSSTMSFNEDTEMLRKLKTENRMLKTIVFGSHSTFMPKFALKQEGVDIIIMREPEFILRDLLRAMKRDDDFWKSIKGIGFKEDGRLVINELYPFIENLDELPFLDVSMLPKSTLYFNPIVKRLPYIAASTSRGCPGRCTFCTAPAFDGMKLRFQSSKYVLDEIEYFIKDGFREVYFRDDTFFVNKKRDLEICDGILKRGLDITWIANARVGMIDKEMMQLAKKAGCHLIKFGVESGVQRILDNVKKGITIEQTIQTFCWAKEAEIDTHAHIMLGMPGETEKTIKETIDLALKIKPTTVTFGICTPYPGAPLFEEIKKRCPNIFDGTQVNLSNLHIKGLYNEYYTNVSKNVLERSVRKAYKKFYFRPSYIFSWIKKIRNLNNIKKLFLAGVRIFDFSIRGED